MKPVPSTGPTNTWRKRIPSLDRATAAREPRIPCRSQTVVAMLRALKKLQITDESADGIPTRDHTSSPRMSRRSILFAPLFRTEPITALVWSASLTTIDKNSKPGACFTPLLVHDGAVIKCSRDGN
jgi:hypothetical protein